MKRKGLALFLAAALAAAGPEGGTLMVSAADFTDNTEFAAYASEDSGLLQTETGTSEAATAPLDAGESAGEVLADTETEASVTESGTAEEAEILAETTEAAEENADAVSEAATDAKSDGTEFTDSSTDAKDDTDSEPSDIENKTITAVNILDNGYYAEWWGGNDFSIYGTIMVQATFDDGSTETFLQTDDLWAEAELEADERTETRKGKKVPVLEVYLNGENGEKTVDCVYDITDIRDMRTDAAELMADGEKQPVTLQNGSNVRAVYKIKVSEAGYYQFTFDGCSYAGGYGASADIHSGETDVDSEVIHVSSLTEADSTLSDPFYLMEDKTYYVDMNYDYSCGDEDEQNPVVACGLTVKELCQWETVSLEEPTCGKEGKLSEICTLHGETRESVLPETGKHTAGPLVETRSSTAVIEGEKVQKCTVCGKVLKTEKIAKIPAKYTLNIPDGEPLLLKTGQSFVIKVSGFTMDDSVAYWSTSDKNIATVNNGKITGRKKGKAQISIKLRSETIIRIQVNVQKTAVKTTSVYATDDGIKVSRLTLARGTGKTLSAVVAPLTSKQTVTWSSSDKKIVSVTSGGEVKALKGGKADITVKSGNQKYVVTVKVPKTATQSVSGVPASKKLKKGRSFKIKAKVFPKYSDYKVTYSSSNKKVATVSAKGKVTAKKKGKAVITVKSGNIKVKCKVTVK